MPRRCSAGSGLGGGDDVRTARHARGNEVLRWLNGAELLGLSAVLVAAPTAALFFVGLFDPVDMMLDSFDSVQRAAADLARIVGVTLGGAAPKERPEGPITHPGTALVVHDVHHRYSTGPDVLHGVRLELPAGKPLEIVGATGSGKSTLATGASDGRRRIMLVTQEHHLFLGTVADNLPPARRDASPSDLAAVGATGCIDALRAA